MESFVREVTFSAVCFGVCRNSQGNLDTDKLFTGQRLDDTGLYYYNARYYDATIGRFISADPFVQDITNPQSLNRYTYCLNNPLKYVDPSGYNWFTDWWSDRWHDVCDTAGDWWNLQKANWNLIVHHDEQSWTAYKEALVRLSLPSGLEADLEKGGTYSFGLQGTAACPFGIATGGWEYSFSLKGGFKDRTDTWSYVGKAIYTDFQLSAGPYAKQTNAENVLFLDPDREVVSFLVSVTVGKLIGPGASLMFGKGPSYKFNWLGLSLDIGLLPVSFGAYPASWFAGTNPAHPGQVKIKGNKWVSIYSPEGMAYIASKGSTGTIAPSKYQLDPNIEGGF